MNDTDKKMLDDLVQDFCRRAQLYGCDAVQVLLSIHDEAKEETDNLCMGRGNWFARQGMARDFIERDVARVGEYVRISEFFADDEEDED